MNAIPIEAAIKTRPAGPIQFLSNAYLRKNATPRNIASTPMRLNQFPPMRSSRSILRVGVGAGHCAGRPGGWVVPPAAVAFGCNGDRSTLSYGGCGIAGCVELGTSGAAGFGVPGCTGVITRGGILVTVGDGGVW